MLVIKLLYAALSQNYHKYLAFRYYERHFDSWAADQIKGEKNIKVALLLRVSLIVGLVLTNASSLLFQGFLNLKVLFASQVVALVVSILTNDDKNKIVIFLAKPIFTLLLLATSISLLLASLPQKLLGIILLSSSFGVLKNNYFIELSKLPLLYKLITSIHGLLNKAIEVCLASSLGLFSYVKGDLKKALTYSIYLIFTTFSVVKSYWNTLKEKSHCLLLNHYQENFVNRQPNDKLENDFVFRTLQASLEKPTTGAGINIQSCKNLNDFFKETKNNVVLNLNFLSSKEYLNLMAPTLEDEKYRLQLDSLAENIKHVASYRTHFVVYARTYSPLLNNRATWKQHFDVTEKLKELNECRQVLEHSEHDCHLQEVNKNLFKLAIKMLYHLAGMLMVINPKDEPLFVTNLSQLREDLINLVPICDRDGRLESFASRSYFFMFFSNTFATKLLKLLMPKEQIVDNVALPEIKKVFFSTEPYKILYSETLEILNVYNSSFPTGTDDRCAGEYDREFQSLFIFLNKEDIVLKFVEEIDKTLQEGFVNSVQKNKDDNLYRFYRDCWNILSGSRAKLIDFYFKVYPFLDRLNFEEFVLYLRRSFSGSSVGEQHLFDTFVKQTGKRPLIITPMIYVSLSSTPPARKDPITYLDCSHTDIHIMNNFDTQNKDYLSNIWNSYFAKHFDSQVVVNLSNSEYYGHLASLAKYRTNSLLIIRSLNICEENFFTEAKEKFIKPLHSLYQVSSDELLSKKASTKHYWHIAKFMHLKAYREKLTMTDEFEKLCHYGVFLKLVREKVLIFTSSSRNIASNNLPELRSRSHH